MAIVGFNCKAMTLAFFHRDRHLIDGIRRSAKSEEAIANTGAFQGLGFRSKINGKE